MNTVVLIIHIEKGGIGLTDKITIDTPYITMSQALKILGVVSSGGQVKWFLEEYNILLNEQQEQRRGKKLYPGDVLDIENVGKFHIVN